MCNHRAAIGSNGGVYINPNFSLVALNFWPFITVCNNKLLLLICFRYMREYALLFREESLFISIDDKHKIKVGEPNCPVASAERGRRVPMRCSL